MSASSRATVSGRRNEGAKVMTLVSAMALGADCIDDCDVLRSGRTADGARASRGGALDAGHVSARVHVRACPPARPRARRDAPARVGGGRRPGRRAAGRRRRLVRRRGLRPRQAGRGVRLHPQCAAITRSSRPAPTPARCCTSGCGRARRTPRAGSLRFFDELIARVDARRRDGPEAAAGRLRASGTSRPSTALDRAGWQFSIGVRLQPARPRGDRGDRRGRLDDAAGLPRRPRSRRSPRPRSAAGGWSSAASAPSIAKANCCPAGSCFRF